MILLSSVLLPAWSKLDPLSEGYAYNHAQIIFCYPLAYLMPLIDCEVYATPRRCQVTVPVTEICRLRVRLRPVRINY